MMHGYIRCSTEEQVQGTSLDDQERTIRGLAMARGVDAFGLMIYRDEGVSGAKPFRWRPAGSELWEAAQPGDVVVAAKLDRMFRNALDAQQILEEWRVKKVDLILYDLGIDPITRDGGIAKVLFVLLAAFAELEHGRIRERVLDGKKAKIKAGGHAGGPAPLGFKVVGRGREAKLEPDEREQHLLALLREWGTDINPGVALRKLREQGLAVGRTGQPLQLTQIKRMLERAGDTP